MAQIYNDPINAADSTIGPQFNTSYWDRKSLIDAAEEMYFSPLADAKFMPKHYGKKLKVFYYVPLLDDRNVNDQGLDAAGASYAGGNIYGSSKDVGTIAAKMPTLTENGGRVNRVGFTRLEKEGVMQEHGIFTEFTEDSLTFDTDSELYGHYSRELVGGANELTEDLLQIDLLNAAGVIGFSGAATQDSEMIGEGAAISLVTYADLKKLSIILDDNRTPKHTKIIKGSNLTDTKTINASRMLYISSDLQMHVEDMLDTHGNAAFTPVRKYADATNIMKGEIGQVGDFRIIIVPNMMKWEGAGDAVVSNEGYRETGGNYDIYPMLVVGDESFATIGLQSAPGTKGKPGKQKFKIIMKKPGKEMATTADPYGKLGFTSIAFWHGFIALRPERIGLQKTVAPE